MLLALLVGWGPGFQIPWHCISITTKMMLLETVTMKEICMMTKNTTRETTTESKESSIMTMMYQVPGTGLGMWEL